MLFGNQRVTRVSDEAALHAVQGLVNIGENGRDMVTQALHRSWLINIAHFLGLQNFDIDQVGLSNFDVNLLAAAKDQFTANHIFRIVLGQVARLSASKPEMDVTPKSPDIDDQHGAKVGAHFLAHWDDVFRSRLERLNINFWTSLCGNAFVRTDFNPNGGRTRSLYRSPFDGSLLDATRLSEQERQWLDSLPETAQSREDRKEGRLEEEVLAPFQVRVPGTYPTLDEMPWLMIEHNRSIDWLWDNYPKQAKDIRPDDAAAQYGQAYWRRLSSLASRYGFTLGNADLGWDNVTVRELWVPPSGRVPKGARIVATKDVLLANDPHPFAERDMRDENGDVIRFPVEHFVYAPCPGRFWGISLVEQLIGPQREYNEVRRQNIKIRDVMGTPIWLVSKRSEISSYRMETGDVWEYNDNAPKPELVPAPPASGLHETTKEAALLDLQTISAQSEASQAQVPTGVRSGIAIRALQEKDQMVIGPTVDVAEVAWGRVGQRRLLLTHAFVDTPTLIRIYGEFRQSDIAIYKGSDLNGNVFVRVRQGSMMPRSKADTQSMMLELLQLGAINPMNPKHSRMMWQAFEVGSADQLFLEEDLDRRRQKIENQMFLRPAVDRVTGQPQPFPDVQDYDDHAAHIEELMFFIKTDAFETLPIARKMAVLAHKQKHERLFAQMVQAQQAMQAMSQPASGPGGGSSPKEPGKASQPRERQPTPGTEG